jgi:hypothetical protein
MCVSDLKGHRSDNKPSQAKCNSQKLSNKKVNLSTTLNKTKKPFSRLQPYSTTNINLMKYGLRPRKNLVSPIRFDPSQPPENGLRHHHSSAAILTPSNKQPFSARP